MTDISGVSKDSQGYKDYVQPPSVQEKFDPPSPTLNRISELQFFNKYILIIQTVVKCWLFFSSSGGINNSCALSKQLFQTSRQILRVCMTINYMELSFILHSRKPCYNYMAGPLGPLMIFGTKKRLRGHMTFVAIGHKLKCGLCFGNYAVLTYPLERRGPGPSGLGYALQLIVIMIGFIICWSKTNMKWNALTKDFFSDVQILALYKVRATKFINLADCKTEHFTFDNTEQDFTKIALSFYSGLFAYNGWNYLNFVIEELKDPVKNLPKAIYISITLVTVVYVLTNIAFYTTLSPQEVLNSGAVAVTFGERLYRPVDFLVPVFVALSTFGSVNGILFTSSRLFYAGALEGQMPEILTMIQVDRMTPTPAVLFMAFLSLIYLGSSDIGRLIDYVGFATWLSIGLAVVCVPYLRWKCPDMERPIKVNLIWPILYIIATLFITIVPMIAAPYETGIGLAIIMTGLPVYLIFIKTKKPVSLQNTLNDFTKFLQKVMMVVRPSTSKQS
ncbi:unnamed protein product, partial [Meganyctiphanes norvegica]